jgi:polysaccharide export outer membrane protein
MRPTRLVTVAAAAALSLSVAHAEPPLNGCPAEYVIGLEDVLDIAVWGNAELTRTMPVRPDGKISLPLLNDVQAAGLTPMQLRDTLTQSLASYLTAPNVSVIVREVHSFKVTVIGEVKTAGRYELKSRATILDVLAMAGGPTDYAERGKIQVLRQQGGSLAQIPFEMDKVTEKPQRSDAAANVCLMPGDIVVVP